MRPSERSNRIRTARIHRQKRKVAKHCVGKPTHLQVQYYQGDNLVVGRSRIAENNPIAPLNLMVIQNNSSFILLTYLSLQMSMEFTRLILHQKRRATYSLMARELMH